jgi:hypothetical protein
LSSLNFLTIRGKIRTPNLDKVSIRKRHMFDYEHEVRIIAQDDTPNPNLVKGEFGFQLPFNPATLIDAIWIHPEARTHSRHRGNDANNPTQTLTRSHPPARCMPDQIIEREPTRLPSCSLDARGNVYLSCLYTMSGAAHSTLLYLVDGSRLRSARPSILA